MVRQVYKKGKWAEGAAPPEQLRQDLRELPSDLVTKEVGAVDKIHAADPPHIIENLKRDYVKNQTAETKKTPLECLRRAPAGQVVPITQEFVDVERLIVIKNLVDSNIEALNKDRKYVPDLRVKHLWFPDNNVNCYELREGNPPRDKERPKHMRGISIEIDITTIPKSIQDMLQRRGISIKDLLTPKKKAGIQYENS